jgi:hypothetical protein
MNLPRSQEGVNTEVRWLIRRGEVSPLAPALRAYATPLSGGAAPATPPPGGPRPPGPPINNINFCVELTLIIKFLLSLRVVYSDILGRFRYGGIPMKRYCIKCEPGRVEYLDIIEENREGYFVRVTRIKDGYKKVIEELLSRHLFDICLKTGYIYKAERTIASVA